MYDPIMGRIIVMAWMMSLVVHATAGAGGASGGGGGGGAVAAEAPTPAELFEAVRQQEAWFTNLPQGWLTLDLENGWANGDAGLLELELPTQGPIENMVPDALLITTDAQQIAWDGERVATHKGPRPYIEAHIFDGSRSVSINGPGSWEILPPSNLPQPGQWLRWPHLSSMTQWFAESSRADVDLNEVSLEGVQQYRGRECYVLRALMPLHTRWFIGVADRRLYGYQSDRTLPLDQREEYMRQAMAQHGVSPEDSDDDAPSNAMHGGVDEADLIGKISGRMEPPVRRTFNSLIGDAGRPDMELWFDDYREVPEAGGIYPFEQGMRVYYAWPPDAMRLSVSRLRVKTLNTTYVPDDLFYTQPPAGASVTDRTRFVPGFNGLPQPVSYSQPAPSPWRNPANWPSLLKASISTSGLIAFSALGLAAGAVGWTLWRVLGARWLRRRNPVAIGPAAATPSDGPI